MFNIKRNVYLEPAFLICAIVLALSASVMSAAIKHFGIILKKEPLSLKKSLQFLDEDGLAPYRVIKKARIENKDVLKGLGTEDYIQWILEDTETDSESNVHNLWLFITYYDLPDRVPHVPEECYAGGGNQLLNSDGLTVECHLEEESSPVKIPIRYLVFGKTGGDFWQRSTKFSVMYLFNVNKNYANNRGEARAKLHKNIFSKHAYFSKIEWWFTTKHGANAYPEKKEAAEASRKLLSIILPILEKEYWPEIKK